MPRHLASGEFASISPSETFSADFVHAQELVESGVIGSPGGTRELVSRPSCEGGGAGRGFNMRVVVQNPPAVRRTVAGRWKERLRLQRTGAGNEHNEQGVDSKTSMDVVLIDHHGDLSKTTLDSEVRGRERVREGRRARDCDRDRQKRQREELSPPRCVCVCARARVRVQILSNRIQKEKNRTQKQMTSGGGGGKRLNTLMGTFRINSCHSLYIFVCFCFLLERICR
jgi:hypothetical protein